MDNPPPDAGEPAFGRVAWPVRDDVVFVTGATGLLGYAIARELALAGARVRALVRGGPLPGELPALGVTPIAGGLADVAALRRGLAGARWAFHVAADVRMYQRAWVEALATNVEGTRNFMEAALAEGVERAVYTSSGSTLGKPLEATRGEPVPIDESSAYNLAPLGMVYPHTKWLGEEETLRAVDRGLHAVITHPTAITGPWDWKHNLLPLYRAPRGGAGLFVPDGWRSVVDVRDVAAGHLAAALHGPAGARYVLSGEAMSVRDFFALIAREAGGRAPLGTLPAGVVVAAGRALETLAALRGRAPLVSAEMALQSTLRVRPLADRARRELGYRTRPAAESVRDAVAWYRAEGLLPP